MPGYCGIVDEYVHAAEIPGGIRYDSLNIGELTDVGLNGETAPARLGYFGLGTFNGLAIDISHGHVCTGLGEQQRSRFTDTLPGTRH